MSELRNSQVSKTPLTETFAKTPHSGGRWPMTDGTMWLYRTVPLVAMQDSKTDAEAMDAGRPLALAFQELASLARNRGLNRRMVRASYRDFHLLAVNFPRLFTPPESVVHRDWLIRHFPDREVPDRRLLFGVQLRAATRGKTLKETVESASHTFFEGGSLLTDYDRDYEILDAAFARAGFGVPDAADFAAANGWWKHGELRAIPYMQHLEHQHFFRSTASAQTAERSGAEDCATWSDTPQHMAVTFATVSDMNLGFRDAKERITWWGSQLIQSNARVVSIRGSVEPAGITRQELGSQRRRVRGDLEDARKKGKDPEGVREREAVLDDVERAYDRDRDTAPPTMVDTSIIVGFAGIHDDVEDFSQGVYSVEAMTNRQEAAWFDTMPGSRIRSSPYLHEFPSSVLAYAGLNDLSMAGDKDGVLVGFTERDGQPVWLNERASSKDDAAPTVLVAAGTGSGKTMLLEWLAVQQSMSGVPGCIIDPKPNSDISHLFRRKNDRVVSLGDLLSSSGGLDPLTLYSNPMEGVPLAGSVIANVNPWGDSATANRYETRIARALKYGIEQGESTTGGALRRAQRDGIVAAEVTEQIYEAAETHQMFRAMFGEGKATSRLADSQGMTLFMRGTANFPLPTAGAKAGDESLEVRLTYQVLRLLVRGSMQALAGRGGVVHMDEAWALERAAPQELEEMGRLARSLEVLPILYTQTPSGPLDLGLRGYISRGFIGHMKDPVQASAGLDLFGGDSPEHRRRVMASNSLAGDRGLNWDSLRALRKGGHVLRGSVFYHSDLKERFPAVEIAIPDHLVRELSTTPEEMRAREAAGLTTNFD